MNRVLVLEKETFGGQITHSPKVENYPGFLSVSGVEFADKLEKASIMTMEQGIMDTLESVEEAKVINGVPFYTRGWATKDGEVSVKTLTMSSQKQFAKEHGIEVAWDESSAQYYGENTVDGTSYEIWMEDAESLKVKLAVMNQYGIAGVAHWKLGLETSDVWEIIGEYLNE